MFKERYLGANAYVEMTDGIDRSMLAKLGRCRRRLVLAVVLVLMALLMLAPWAASKPAAYRWLSQVAPPVARWLSPSTGSDTENGIRVEAAEVTREGDVLHLHLTVEDLEGDRLNGKTYPEHWTYEQGVSSGIGPCTQRFDEETGLLHLFLTFEPSRNIPDFDWERWVTVKIEDLLTRTDLSLQQVSIPLILTQEPSSEPIATLQEGLDVTSMTVTNGNLQVRVDIGQYSTFREYRLDLRGPQGELLHPKGRAEHGDHTVWTFDLRGRDAQACTLTAWLDITERIAGSWHLRVSPLTAP